MKRKIGKGLKAIVETVKLAGMLFIPGGFYPYLLYENHKEMGKNDFKDHRFFAGCEIVRDMAYYMFYCTL
ncbi:hypothetical protein HOA55_02635 [archaeon]|jgi:hypothetical protein|nr:hypothetical protein [archaeon]MBT3577216.1 hypothetical protein [archaeon]MBT6820225.1 hypothetical protein [archaeon]MBT6956744.1 hypothetical protein [archaeon]MBT7025429.1 hypothetical protein [archaeon]